MIDRSFSSLSLTASLHALGPMGSMVGGIFGAAIGLHFCLASLFVGAVPTPPAWLANTIIIAYVIGTLFSLARPFKDGVGR